jgi:hypothetical protein
MAATLDVSQLFRCCTRERHGGEDRHERRVVVGSIRGIKEPQGLYYIPRSNTLAVASGGGGDVQIYDQDLKLIGTVKSLPDADRQHTLRPGKRLSLCGI